MGINQVHKQVTYPAQSVDADFFGVDKNLSFEFLAEILDRQLKTIDDVSELVRKNFTELVNALLDYLKKPNEQKALGLKKQAEDLLKEIKKKEKASGLQKIAKALGVVALVIGAVSMIASPNPVTISLFVMSLALVAEPMVASCAGYESVTAKAFGDFSKFMSKELGATTGGIAAAVGLTLLVLVVSVVMPWVLARCGAVIANLAPGASCFEKFSVLMQSLFKDPAFQTKFYQGLQMSESAVICAQHTTEAQTAQANFDIAKIQRDKERLKADLQLLESIVQMLTDLFTEAQSKKETQSDVFVKAAGHSFGFGN